MVFILVLAVIFLDQLTKFLAVNNLPLGGSLAVLPGVFHMTLVHNTGAAFGLLKGQVPLFIAFSVLAVILICSNLRCRGWSRFSFYSIALALILAGAAGNLIDRWRLGYVIDFLDFRVWPVFNIADSAITIGAVLLGWVILKPKNKKCTPSSVK